MAELSQGARNYRALMWGMILLAMLPLVLFVAAVRNVVPRQARIAALPLVFACLATAVWMGWRGHRQALADRERVGRTTMIMAIAAQLGRQDDAALERLAAKGGPAAEAAALLLAGRAEKRARQG